MTNNRTDAHAVPWVFNREWFIRLTLITVCAGFWYSSLNLISFPLLIVACLLDGGLRRSGEALGLPLVQALLALCLLLLLGLTWSEAPMDGRMKWLKYFVLLIFVPFYLLLNRDRLPLALGSLVAGYLSVFALGIYQWQLGGEQGIPLLGMTYLSFSAMLGAGVVVLVGIVCMSQSVKWRIALGIVAISLWFVQFHQNGRVLLVATVIAVLLMILLRYRIEARKMIVLVLSVSVLSGVFAFNSPAFQSRWAQAESDIALLRQGNFNSSLGYRLAMWDVGVHALLQRPWTGYGTGMPALYFDQAVGSYKDGLYQDLLVFQKTVHFHNEWIEIGMHVGLPGMIVLFFIFWGWYQVLKHNGLQLLGAGMIGFMVLAGMTDTFLIFSRTPILLLFITAIAIRWMALANQPVVSGVR